MSKIAYARLHPAALAVASSVVAFVITLFATLGLGMASYMVHGSVAYPGMGMPSPMVYFVAVAAGISTAIASYCVAWIYNAIVFSNAKRNVQTGPSS